MKFFAVLSMILILACVGLGQRPEIRESTQTELKALDQTESWQYPYKIADVKRQKLLDVLKNFKDTVEVGDIFGKLGKPDRIDDLSKSSKPLSHFEDGFVDGSNDRYSFRCIWFARKASKSPGLSDSWLAAYVDKGQKTVSVIHSNYLQPAEIVSPGSSDGQGSGIGTGRGVGGSGPPATGLKILSKPRPSFTEKACQQNFSGTVILRVTFLASAKSAQ
jgi:hypothetical protein